MSKTKSSEIPHYELLYLISNKFSEDEVKPIMGKVNSLITSQGGKITRAGEAEKKRLAYAIKGFHFGYYVLVEFDLEGAKLANLDRSLGLMSEILRQQIITKRILTQEQIERAKKIAEKIAAKNLAEEKAAKEKTAVKASDKDKVDLKDLDEKLDKILETDNLL